MRLKQGETLRIDLNTGNTVECFVAWRDEFLGGETDEDNKVVHLNNGQTTLLDNPFTVVGERAVLMLTLFAPSSTNSAPIQVDVKYLTLNDNWTVGIYDIELDAYQHVPVTQLTVL